MTQTLAIMATLAFGAMFLIALRRHRRRVYLNRLKIDTAFAMTEAHRHIVETIEAMRQVGLSFAKAQQSVRAFQSAWYQAEARHPE